LMAYVVVCCDWAILIVLGEQWMEAVPIFRTMIIGAIILPVANAMAWILISQSRVRDELVWQSLTLPIRVLLILIGLNWGVLGVSAAVALRHYILTPFRFWQVGRTGPVRTSDLYSILPMPAFVIAVVFATVSIARYAIESHFSPIIGLIMCLFVATLSTLACLMTTALGRQMVFRGYADIKTVLNKPGKAA